MGRAITDCEILAGLLTLPQLLQLPLRHAFNNASLSLQQSTRPRAGKNRNSIMSIVGGTDLFGEAQGHFMLSLMRRRAQPQLQKRLCCCAAASHNSSSSQSSIWRSRNYTFARSLVPSFSRRPLQHRWKQHLGQLGLTVGALFSSLQAVFSP